MTDYGPPWDRHGQPGAGGATGPDDLPGDVQSYLSELVRRVRDVYGDRLVSVGAVGSLALGDYRHGRSDIDIAVVVDPSVPVPAAHELAQALAHPGFRCPAAGLELVVYDADFAVSGAPGAGYLLNLNTGPLLPAVADYDPGGTQGFWFVIDRAVGQQSGWTLAGRSIREALGAAARRDLLAAVAESVREHAAGQGHLADNRVLNGCRSVLYCRTGRWAAKRAAGRSIAAAEPRFRPVVDRALRSFERPRGAARDLPVEEVNSFLSWVRRDVDRECGAVGS
ncbi:aminoglycoside adenylyltransferase domain-containing protein [Nocardia carnea]|uniref:aminoglycoside adenylyltransferase domain-containing protein n=1 Tax=Nocardia carnea TaxID=37328 RepID=UPI00245851D1|nr:aminoglycoside adenylyltransferase domain-containing protein [Nocardia carnea]